MITLPRIALEAQARLVQQLWRHRQVALRGRKIYVPKVGRKFGQALSEVDSAAVPCNDSMHGSSVPKVVKAGLTTASPPGTQFLPQRAAAETHCVQWPG